MIVFRALSGALVILVGLILKQFAPNIGLLIITLAIPFMIPLFALLGTLLDNIFNLNRAKSPLFESILSAGFGFIAIPVVAILPLPLYLAAGILTTLSSVSAYLLTEILFSPPEIVTIEEG